MNTFAMRSQLRKKALQSNAPVPGKRFLIATLAIFATLLLTVAAPRPVFAQAQNTGSIYGSAVDASGAVIANATVSATSSTTGAERTVTTNKAGEYALQNMAVGTYTVTVTAPGFESYVVDSVAVDADANVKIVAKLAIGRTDVVTVQSESSAVDAHSATIGTLIDNNLVEDLPVDGRNVVAMAGLLPGVTQVNAPTSATGDTSGPTYSVSGSRSTQNLMLFDGLMWNNLFFNTGVNYPPPNALQEISVLLNNYKAQYGRNSGSVFNVITKSGTNTIHGAVWEYLHNQMFDAQDYLFPLPSGKAPEDNIHQFGATIGGPIKQDKLFYFASVQAIISHGQRVAVATGAQGYAERGFRDGSPNVMTALTGSPQYDRPCTTNGPFGTNPPSNAYPFAGLTCASFASDVTTYSTATDGSGSYPVLGKFTNPLQITPSSAGADPGTATDMINTGLGGSNNSPAPCIAELNSAYTYAQNYYYQYDVPANTMPAPTAPAPGVPVQKVQGSYMPNAEIPTNCLNPVTGAVLAKYVSLPTVGHNGRIASVTAAPQPKNDLNVLFRVDWIVSQKHTLDLRYNSIHGSDNTAAGVSGASIGVANYEIDHNTVGMNFGNIGDTWQITPNIANVARLGYKRYENFTVPTDNHTYSNFNPGGPNGIFVEPGVPVLPVFSISGQFTIGAAGAGGGSGNQAWSDHVNEDIEFLDQLLWSHGKHNYQFGANFLRLQYNNNQDYPGQLSFSTAFTGLALADFSMGLPGSVQANSPLQQGGIQHNLFVYAQDDWRMTPKLTLNLGARYELPFQWYQPSGYSSTFIPGHQSTVFPGAIGGLAYPGDPGVLKSLVPTDFNGLVPRVGFAYDVFGTGRLAIRGGFGMFFDAVNANVIGVGEPFYFQYNQLFPDGGASDPLLLQAGTNVRKVIPNGYDKNNPQFQAPYSLFFPDRNFRTPYTEAINIGFQYKIPHGGTLETNYIGKFSRKLTIPFDLNPAITDCSGGYFQANPTVYGTSQCGGQATASPSSTRQRLRYTQFNYGGGGLVDFASIGTANYNGLQMQYQQRGGKHLTLIASYTYSKSIDLQTDGTGAAGKPSSIPNPFNVSSERGLSDYDSRHILNLGWTLNFPKLHYGPNALRAVLNDWNYAGQYNARTGQPFSVIINNDTALNGEPRQRAELVPGMNPRLPNNRHRAAKVQQWFNTAAFTYPVTGTLSKVPRNFLTGPAYINTNMELGRYFPMNNVRQGMKLYFRAEAFNVFNTPNLSNPSATFNCSNSSISNTTAGLQPCTGLSSGTPNQIRSTTYGVVQSTVGVNGGTQSTGRKMQFSLTLYY